MRIEGVKDELLRAQERLERVFAHTPDDRINWSPSPTARTPVEMVVHAAAAVGHIHGWLSGEPFTPPSTAEADRFFREKEGEFKTREEALAFLHEKTSAYLAWLDKLTSSDFERSVTLPFGMGDLPVGAGLDIPAGHMNEHSAQLEYLQTIYGDRDWHLGF